MKKLLKAIVAFMERKWPDQVVVTKEKYDDIQTQITTIHWGQEDLSKRISAMAVEFESKLAPLEKIKEMEREITRLNATLGIGERVQRPSVFQR